MYLHGMKHGDNKPLAAVEVVKLVNHVKSLSLCSFYLFSFLILCDCAIQTTENITTGLELMNHVQNFHISKLKRGSNDKFHCMVNANVFIITKPTFRTCFSHQYQWKF